MVQLPAGNQVLPTALKEQLQSPLPAPTDTILSAAPTPMRKEIMFLCTSGATQTNGVT